MHAIDDAPFPISGARAVVREAQSLYERLGEGGQARLVEVAGGHGLHPAMRDAAAAGLADALGLPPLAPEAPVELLDAPYAVTHEVGRADRDRGQTHVRPAARLAGESLPANVDTNGVLVEHARARALELRRGRSPSIGEIEELAGRSAPLGIRASVSNHVVLDDEFAQRLAIEVAPGVTLDAVLVLPDGWQDEAPGVLVAIDEGGKSRALATAAARLARTRRWAVLAVDLRGTGESAAGEFELSTAAWMLDRDLLASRVDDLLAVVQWLSERYSTGQQIDKRRIAVWGPDAFGLVALLAAALDERIAGAASGPFVESLEELLVESPRVTPMAFPFAALERFDLADLVRLAGPRPVHVAGADGDGEALVGALLDSVDEAA